MNKAVVLDLGTETVKYGLSGDDAPKEIPTVFAKPRPGAPEPQETRLYGTEALEKRGEWTLRFPVEHGAVMNWDDMEVFLTHLLSEKMSVEGRNHPFIVASQVLTPKSSKERAAFLMFETFECPFYLGADQTVLSLLDSGKRTGFVVDAGKSSFQAAPVYEGHVLSHTILRSIVGGADVRDHLSRSLSNRLQVEESNIFRETCGQALQKHCYIAQDFELEQQKVLDPIHFETLQNDQFVSFDLLEEAFTAPEVIFQPSIMGRETLGLHHLIVNTIKRCDPSIQADLFANILITGKSSLFPGFEKRLQAELEKLAPAEHPVQVSRSLDPAHSSWLGGSALASRPDFEKMCLSKDEWDEEGPNLVHRFFF